jgi:methyl coenzyme M reductase alpha subunit
MPRAMQRAVREAQEERGSICRKLEVLQAGWKQDRRKTVAREGKQKDQEVEERRPKRCKRQDFGVVLGLKRTRSPNSISSEAVVVNRCQRSHQRRAGSGKEVSSGWVPRK